MSLKPIEMWEYFLGSYTSRVNNSLSISKGNNVLVTHIGVEVDVRFLPFFLHVVGNLVAGNLEQYAIGRT